MMPDNAAFYLSTYQWMTIWVIASFFAIMDNAAIEIHVQIFIWIPGFASFEYVPGSSSAGFCIIE